VVSLFDSAGKELHGSRNMSLSERFWLHVDIRGPDECWPWTARTDRDGYGTLTIRALGRKYLRRAHRIAWRVTRGYWPKRQVLHRCDSPPCCNPKHLFLGTSIDNVRDKCNKGRTARGEANGGGGKLTELEVLDIRSRLATGEAGNVLARKYEVSTTMIARINRRRNWAWL